MLFLHLVVFYVKKFMQIVLYFYNLKLYRLYIICFAILMLFIYFLQNYYMVGGLQYNVVIEVLLRYIL